VTPILYNIYTELYNSMHIYTIYYILYNKIINIKYIYYNK